MTNDVIADLREFASILVNKPGYPFTTRELVATLREFADRLEGKPVNAEETAHNSATANP